MKIKWTPIVLLLLGSLSASSAAAQCASGYFDHLSHNQVRARFHNSGDHFWNLVDAPSYEVPAGSGKHMAFASSLWIGGLDPNNSLHLAANTYRQQGIDYFAGPYRNGGGYVCDRGFTTPSNVFLRGLKTIASGKVMAFYSNGFTVYNPATGTTVNRILPVIRNNYEAAELPDGRILLFGDDVYPVKSDAMIVDTVNFNVQTIGQLNHFHKHSSATRLSNGQILLAGIVGCEVFDPATSSAVPVSSLNTPRTFHASVLLPNGKVLIAGGSTNLSGGGSMPGTELFDPAGGTWAVGPVMSVARTRANATLLANNEVLITGGATLSTDFSVYNYVTNTVSPSPGLQEPLMDHTVMNLGNNELLITHDVTGFTGKIIRFNPLTQASSEVRLTGTGYHGSLIGGGSAMIEREPNRFAQFDLQTNRLVDQPWQYIWNLSRSQINQFLSDFANNQVNFANYPDIQTWPANGDTAAGEDLYLAPFVDVNQDGLYRPLQDGDYPCIAGDQALWWAYNDDGPHTETSGDRVGIQVEQMSYVYDCGSTPCGADTFLDYSTFHHLEITNKSGRDYHQVYVGVWTDVDVGNFSDDYVGYDSVLGLGYGYNGDHNDETAKGYGLNPPALGLKFLDNGQISASTHFVKYENDFSATGNPELPVHHYNYLRSIWKDGNHVTYGGNGYGGTNPVNQMFTGDPGACGGSASGWTEGQNPPFDRRMLQSFGPFDLAAGETVDLDYVLIWSRGYYNDNLGSICELKQAAAAVDSFWQAQSHGCFDLVLDRHEPLSPPANTVRIYPNPSQGRFFVELEKALPGDGQLRLHDISGQLVHAQPLPGGLLRYEIQTPSLAEGVYLARVTGDGVVLTQKVILRR